MFGRLHHHPAAVIEPLPSGATGDLVEIARAQYPGFLSVEFAELGEKDRPDGHVDAGAQGVGAANDLEHAPLSELLDQNPIFGQQTGVMQADAVFEPAPDIGAVGAAELESF